MVTDDHNGARRSARARAYLGSGDPSPRAYLEFGTWFVTSLAMVLVLDVVTDLDRSARLTLAMVVGLIAAVAVNRILRSR